MKNSQSKNSIFKKIQVFPLSSYRRERKLSKHLRQKLYSENLTPFDRDIIVRYKFITKETLRDSINWYKEQKNAYLEYLARNPYIPQTLNEKQAKRQLTNMGYVPIETFNRKEGYIYMICDKLKMILPIHLGDKMTPEGLKKRKNADPYYYVNNYSLLNYTRLDRSSWDNNFYKYSENKSQDLRRNYL